MIDAILANGELVTAFVLVTAAIMRWTAWRLDKQRAEHDRQIEEGRQLFKQELQQADHKFEAALERQRQQHEASLMSSRTENLQQRAIADSIYNNVAVNTTALNVIQTLAENKASDRELRNTLQKFILTIEAGNRRNEELLDIAREFRSKHNDSDNESNTSDTVVYGDAG